MPPNALDLSPRLDCLLQPLMLRAGVQITTLNLLQSTGVFLQKRAMADGGNPTAAFLADLERAAGGAENRNKCKTRHQCGDLACWWECAAAPG